MSGCELALLVVAAALELLVLVLDNAAVTELLKLLELELVLELELLL